MESEAYSYGLSDATVAASRSSQLRSHSHFYFDYEEVDGDDVLNAEYPCPFCPEEFDLVELCYHIDEEHPVEAKYGICPICSLSGASMVGHLTMHHGDIFNSQQRLKFHKDDFPQSLSFERKELHDEHVTSILSGFSSLNSTSKMAPDPLLSFLCNAPIINEPKTAQPMPTSKENLEEKELDDTFSERDVQLSSTPDTNREEKTRRCDFVHGV